MDSISKIKSIKGYLYMLLGTLLMTLSNYLYKHAASHDMHPIVLVLYRSVFFCFFATATISTDFKTIQQQFDITKVNSLMFRAFLNSVGKTMVIIALTMLRVSTCELLIRTSTVTSVFLGYIILNEVVTKYDIYGLIATLFGVIFILKPAIIFGSDKSDTADQPLGVALAIGISLLLTIATIMTKTLLKTFNEVYLTFLIGIMGIIFSMVNGCWMQLNMSVNLFQLLLISLNSVLDYGGMVFSLKAINIESIAKMAPFTNCGILYAMLINYIFFNDLDAYDVLGASVMISVYVYSSYKKYNPD